MITTYVEYIKTIETMEKKIKWGANNRKNRFKNKYTVISQAKV